MEENALNALRRAVSDMNELGIDPFLQIAETDDKAGLMAELIEQYGWEAGWVKYYLEIAK